MGDRTNDVDRGTGPSACEECGAADARPVEVQFNDEKERTIRLCGDCLDEFRSAAFVDAVAPLDGEAR